MAFDFDSLILLVGTNPLPNLVTAEFFIRHNPHLENIFLVHSDERDYQDGTLEQAERLQKVIKEREEWKDRLHFEKIHLSDVGNRSITFKDLRERLIPILAKKKVNRLHVNYTGGTKVMAVHVYRFIEKELTDKPVKKKSFSYLDGRCFKIVNDDSDAFISEDLRETTTISFDEIINVHGFRWKSERNSEVISTESLQRIKEEIDRGDIEELKKNMCDFHTKFNEVKKKWKELPGNERAGFEGFDLSKNDLMDLLPVLNGMPEGFRFFDKTGKLDLSKFDFDSKYHTPFTNFFNGLWLEQYIFRILKTGLKNDDICLERNWQIEKEDWDTYFQLDVILKKGYQLFGISCTVGKEKGICKLKGFEVIHRIRQIGGDEAKAVVITMLEDNTAKTLQKELQQDSGIPEGYIKVFGKNDLESKFFLEEIDDFIK